MNAKTSGHTKKELPFKESHAFIIGINEYLRYDNLRTAVNDAKKMAEILAKKQHFNVHPPLINASGSQIIQLMKTITKKVGKYDRALLYFAGHGIADKSADIPQGYLVPADAGLSGTQGLIPMHEIHAFIKKLPCKHFLLILDCCFSGSFEWSVTNRTSNWAASKIVFKEEYMLYVHDRAWQVLTSSAYDQTATDLLNPTPFGNRDAPEMKHSPFAEALFKGLEGAADIVPPNGGNGLITATELYVYIRQQVEYATTDKSESARQTPRFFALGNHDKGEFVFFHPTHPLNLPPVPKRNPFKGLDSFDEKDKDYFFGRKQAINALVSKTATFNVIVLTGASGTGKSSLAKAGLIPTLRKQGFRIIPPVKPGQNPVAALTKALSQSKLFPHPLTLPNDSAMAAQIICNDNRNTLILIDQLEELITQCTENNLKEHFITIINDFLEANTNNRLKILFTIRSDFEPQFKRKYKIKGWVNGKYHIPEFTRDQYREIILEPTKKAVLFLSPPSLADTLLDDVSHGRGALPLLSFTLSELYRLYFEAKRPDRTILESDYHALGGIRGALEQRADSVYNQLDHLHKQTLKTIMLRLVAYDDGEFIGKRLPMKDLDFSDSYNTLINRIIDQLIDARLLRKGKDHQDVLFVEPAHDTIIQAWQRLNDWIENYGEDKFILRNRLEKAINDYEKTNDQRFLWTHDPRLTEIQKHAANGTFILNRREQFFINQSRLLKQKKKKISRIQWTTVILLVAVISAFAFLKTDEAQQEKNRKTAATLSAQARDQMKTDNTAAMGIARRAYEYDPSPHVMQTLNAAAATTDEYPFYNIEIPIPRSVTLAVYSPAGDKILTTSSDDVIRLWDLKGNLTTAIPRQTMVKSVAFSPDGQNLLVVSDTQYADLLDLRGARLRRFQHKDVVNSATFSHDGRLVITASEDRTAGIWSSNKKPSRLARIPHPTSVTDAVFCPQCTRCLTVTNGKRAFLWTMNGKEDKYFNSVLKAEFSTLGKYILMISLEKKIKIWDTHKKNLREFTRDKRLVNAAAFAPDESYLLVAYSDGSAAIRDLNDKCLKDYKFLHHSPITTITLSPSDTSFLTVSTDNTVKLWTLDGILTAILDKHHDTITSARFSPDGNDILTASLDKTVKIWKLKAQPTIELNRRKLPVSHTYLSPNGQQVLILSGGPQVHIVDLSGRFTTSLDNHTDMVVDAGFSPDGTQIVTASVDKTARVWDLRGRLRIKVTTHSDAVNRAEFSPDGSKVLTASQDKTAQLTDLNTRKTIVMNKHTEGVNSAVFSPDGTRILTASDDCTAKLWDLEGNLLNNFNIHSFPVTHAIFSPDGRKVLTIAVIARLWATEDTLITQYDRNTGAITCASFSPDGSQILTASDNNSAQLWDLEGNLLFKFTGHTSIVFSALFSHNGKRIITASDDKTVKLWNLQGNLLANFTSHKERTNAIHWLPDDSRILSSANDDTIKLWHTSEALIHWLRENDMTATAPGMTLHKLNSMTVPLSGAH